MVAFSPAAFAEYERLLKRYPTPRSALLPLLWLAQREFKVITPEVTLYLGHLLDIPPADVYSVASFYTMFNKNRVGEYHIQVCRNITCYMKGCRSVVRQIKGSLGIEEGETTPDGKITLSTVECLCSCDTAPMMQINERFYENLTPERIEQILNEIRKDGRDGRAEGNTTF